MNYLVTPVNTVLKAQFKNIDFDKVLRESIHCTYIRSIFPAAQYNSNGMLASLYPSGVVMIHGSADHIKAHNSMLEFIKHLELSKSKNTVSFDNVTKSIQCVNSVYNVKPYTPIIMDMEKLKEKGHTVTSFKTEGIRIEYIAEDTTAHATVYSNGSILLQVAPLPENMKSVFKWLEILFKEYSREK